MDTPVLPQFEEIVDILTDLEYAFEQDAEGFRAKDTVDDDDELLAPQARRHHAQLHILAKRCIDFACACVAKSDRYAPARKNWTSEQWGVVQSFVTLQLQDTAAPKLWYTQFYDVLNALIESCPKPVPYREWKKRDLSERRRGFIRHRIDTDQYLQDIWHHSLFLTFLQRDRNGRSRPHIQRPQALPVEDLEEFCKYATAVHSQLCARWRCLCKNGHAIEVMLDFPNMNLTNGLKIAMHFEGNGRENWIMKRWYPRAMMPWRYFEGRVSMPFPNLSASDSMIPFAASHSPARSSSEDLPVRDEEIDDFCQFLRSPSNRKGDSYKTIASLWKWLRSFLPGMQIDADDMAERNVEPSARSRDVVEGLLTSDDTHYLVSGETITAESCARRTRHSLADVTASKPGGILTSADKVTLALNMASWHLALHPSGWVNSEGWKAESVAFGPMQGESRTHVLFVQSRLNECKAPSPDINESTRTLGLELAELLLLSRHDTSRKTKTLRCRDPVGAYTELIGELSDAKDQLRLEFESLLNFCIHASPSRASRIDKEWRAEFQEKVIMPLRRLHRSTYIAPHTKQKFDAMALELHEIVEQLVIQPEGDYSVSKSFCPDPAIDRFVIDNEKALQELYSAYMAHAIHSHYEFSSHEPRHANCNADHFYDALHCTFKKRMLVTLLYSKTNPCSDIWLSAWGKFVAACTRQVPLSKSLDVTSMPLNDQLTLELFGKDGPEMRAFRSAQYIFCAARLPKRDDAGQLPEGITDVYDTPSRIIMPFIEQTPIGSASAYAKVYAVKIAAGHFEDHEVQLAMKQLRLDSKVRDEWELTEWMFEQRLEHRNIMRAQTSIKLGPAGDQTLFVFSELAVGDLYSYVTDEEASAGPISTRERVQCFDQIVGIASALKYLHFDLKDQMHRVMACFHKDIKAENILVTRGHKGIMFKITDFGISSIKHKSQTSGSETVTHRKTKLFRPDGQTGVARQQNTRTQLGDNCPNAAPEMMNGGEVNASVDVWGFGTVFSEYVSWLYGGAASLKDFESKRRADFSDDRSFAQRPGPDGIQELFLRPGIHGWYENKIAGIARESLDRGIDGEVDKLLLECSWHHIQHDILQCDVEKRSEMDKLETSLESLYADALRTLNSGSMGGASSSRPHTGIQSY